MKQRKPLQVGDYVRWFGYAKDTLRNCVSPMGVSWYRVFEVQDKMLVLSLPNGPDLIKIDRRQVTHIKVKKPRRHWFIKTCAACSDSGHAFEATSQFESIVLFNKCKYCVISKAKQV